MIRDAVLDALAVLLPVECAGCGAPDRGLCGSCAGALSPEVSSRLVGGGLRVWSGLSYEGVVREAVLSFKRDGRTAVARALAPALSAAVIEATPEPEGIAVVAVPGTRRAFMLRGFDPVRVLLSRAGLTPWRVFAAARPHKSQKLLGVGDRELNLAGAFRVRASVAGSRVLLVDDVVTTGATLREAARVLTAAGAEVVGAAVVASTPKRFQMTG